MGSGDRIAARGAGERLAAWLFTGPLGHLYGVTADLAGYGVGEARRAALERLPGGPRGC